MYFKGILFLSVVLAVFAAPPATNLQESAPCDPAKCKLPNCRCSTTDIPGDLDAKNIPQLVSLTFDDAVTAINFNYYEKALFERKNPDGCNVQATYFLSHEYSDYSKVHELYAKGHEIALHSITHEAQTDYWRSATVKQLEDEFVGERELVSHFANIPEDQFEGIRIPFLQLSGDNSFEMIKKAGLIYDCSWPTQSFMDPPLWPYSLDYNSEQDCLIGPCPTASIPNTWVAPMVDWDDDKGTFCAMVDACQQIPKDVDGLVEFMKRNFLRHYESNRAPFGFYVHAAWFALDPNHFEAYIKFLDYLQSLPDVYMVSVSRMLEWVRNPSPLGNLTHSWPKCPAIRTPDCKAQTCKTFKNEVEERYITHCAGTCPETYPWLGNPLGKK